MNCLECDRVDLKINCFQCVRKKECNCFLTMPEEKKESMRDRYYRDCRILKDPYILK